MDQPQFITVGSGNEARDIAYRYVEGSGPGVVWLGGFKSDMLGSKAEAIDAWARENQRSFLRFDYSGHGESGGDFLDGTISRWMEEAGEVIKHLTAGPQILVGSSMGGWISLCLAKDLSASGGSISALAGLVLIAPAADFTEKLMWKNFSDEIRQAIMNEGSYALPSGYGDDPYIITKGLIEDGRNHQIIDEPLQTGCPVHILQGGQDPDVPWQHALEVSTAISHDDVIFTLVKDGDHRLSREDDITRLIAAIEDIA